MSDDLLVKYLLQEATEEERERVEGWIAAAPENARQYRDFKTIWDESRRLAAKSEVNIEAAWMRFQAHISEGQKGRGRTILLRGKMALRLAAGLVLLLGSVVLFRFFRNDGDGRMMAIRSGSTPLTDTLPDGSVVTLNRNAGLRYSEAFSGDERNVILDGEAFFEVAPDKAHPFIITANEARVRVVGTSFNVKSNELATEVIVATGIVEVSRKSERIALLPNEQTTVRKGKAGLQKTRTADELYSYYRSRELVCNNTPLSRLAEILSAAYDVRVEIPEFRLQQLLITATFRNESLAEVLQVIRETLNVRIAQTGNKVVITSSNF